MNDENMHNNVDALLGHLSTEKPSVHVVKNSHKRFYNFILLLAACLSIGFCLVMPVWSDKSSLHIIQDWINSSDGDAIRPLGDDPPSNNSNPAYHHWYAPENSMGIKETKTVNWSYFWQLFRQNSAWQLEAWHPVQEQWVDNWQGTNLNKWLNISRIRSGDNSSEKVTLNVTNNHPTQALHFRFKYGIDLRVKQYVNRSSWYEYELTYPANETENYTVFFNFSDVKPLIQNGVVIPRHGVKEIDGKDIFWFMLTQNMSRGALGAGNSFEIDPTFGHEGSLSGLIDINDIIYGYKASPASSGTGDNITVYIDKTNSCKVKCALYNIDSTLVTNGVTEEKTITADGLYSFNFLSAPTITSGAWYFVSVWSDTSQTRVKYWFSGGDGYNKDEQVYNGFPNPWANTSVDSNGVIQIWCSYTESGANNAPTQSAQKIWNSTIPVEKSLNATGVSLGPTCFNVTIADSDSDQMNVTIKTNGSGTWKTVNATTSGMTDGTYHGYNTSWVDEYNTKYWISFNVSDDSDWCNETYSFWTHNRTNQRLGDHWFLGGNVSGNNRLGDFWFLGENISTKSNQRLGDHWFLGGNISDNNQLGNFWFLGGNETARINQRLGNHWFLGGNETDNNRLGDFWFLGGNESVFLDVYNEYPSNESNIFDLQPTLRFSLTNPTGDLMNYTIFTGNSTANCTHYLDNVSNVNNGTYHYVNYYNATNYTVSYYWRVYANDSTQFVNKTLHFTPNMQGGHVISSQGASIGIAAAALMTGIIALVFAINKRKKKNRDGD